MDRRPDRRCVCRVVRVSARECLELSRCKALLLQHLTPRTITRRLRQCGVPLNGVQTRHRRHERRVIVGGWAVDSRARRDRCNQNAMPHYHPDLHGARTLDAALPWVKHT